MPFFAYKGRNTKGEMVQGVLEGQDSGALAGYLLNLGVTPIDITPTTAPAKEGAGATSFASLFEDKIETIDLMLYSRQMYTLLKAGIPIMRALGGLQASMHNKAFARVVGEIRDSLDSGRELSAAMSQHPKVFSPFYLSMVRVGESTGMLESVIMRMFAPLEFEKYLRDKVK